VKDSRDKRRVDLFASNIELDIEERVNDIFNVDSEEFKIVDLAVKESVICSKINKSTLMEVNYNADSLEDIILRFKGPNYDLLQSNSLISLYNQMVSFYCNCIVGSLIKLPEFKVESIKELLARSGDIVTSLQKVLDQIKDINRISYCEDKGVEKARFEKRYREYISDRYNKVELFGIDLSDDSRVQVLNIAYISIKANIQKEKNEIPIEKILESENRVIIRGLAGSGKTTIAQWVAVNSAASKFRNRLSVLNGYVPFIVRLRDFHEKDLPEPADFISNISKEISSRMPDRWIHEKLESGYAILLIDGLDELPYSKRKDVKEWIDELVCCYPKCKFVLTSRPTAVTKDWLKHLGFIAADLQEMNEFHINKFIDHWHNASNCALDESQSNLASSLKSKVSDNPSLKSLVNTPLICAMVCALHKDRRDKLPEEKANLYRDCINMLVNRRNSERNISDAGYPSLNERERGFIFQELAYWYQKNNATSIDKNRVVEKIGSIIRDTIVNDSEEEILRFFLDRCGLIREPVIGKIDFSHKTFQEFLCAEAINEKDDIEFLIEKSHESGWHEIVIMSSGIFSQSKFNRLIQGLIKKGDSCTKSSWGKQKSKSYYLLAISCLSETIYEVSDSLRKKIYTKIKKIIPPVNLTEANSLASAKALAIKAMGDIRDYKYKQSVACVRTLSKILQSDQGNSHIKDSAFAKLAELKDEKRITVVEQLFKEWFFQNDPDRYYDTVLKFHTSRLAHFYLVRSDIAKYIDKFEKLIYLIISNSIDQKNVAQIKGNLSLQNIRFNDARNICDYSVIGDFPNLKSASVFHLFDSKLIAQAKCLYTVSGVLELMGRNRINISDLEDFKSLSALHLQFDHVDLSNNMMVSLREIGLFDVDRVTLDDELRIESLDLLWCHTGDNNFLNNIAGLKKLSISNSSVIEDLMFLDKSPSLEFIDIDLLGDQVDIEPLLRLQKLKRVRLPSLSVYNLNDWLDFKDRNLNLIRGEHEYHIEAEKWVESNQEANEIEDFTPMDTDDYEADIWGVLELVQ